MSRRPANKDRKRRRHFDLPTARRGRVAIKLPDVSENPGDDWRTENRRPTGEPMIDENSGLPDDEVPYCRTGGARTSAA